jgi:hypothetical protein
LARPSLLASARRRPPCHRGLRRSQTRTACPFATGASIWKPASSGERLARKCARRRCFEIASSVSCERGTRSAGARLLPPVLPPAGTLWCRAGPRQGTDRRRLVCKAIR